MLQGSLLYCAIGGVYGWYSDLQHMLSIHRYNIFKTVSRIVTISLEKVGIELGKQYQSENIF